MLGLSERVMQSVENVQNPLDEDKVVLQDAPESGSKDPAASDKALEVRCIVLPNCDAAQSACRLPRTPSIYSLTGVIAQQAKGGMPSHHAVEAELTNGDAEFREQALALSPLQPALSPLKPESPLKHPIITSIDMQGAFSQSAHILTSRR